MESKQWRIYLQENDGIAKENKVLHMKIKVLRKYNVPFINKNKELLNKMKYCKKKIHFANKIYISQFFMKQSKSNDFVIHIFHGHIYKCICNGTFILRFSQV